MKRKLFVMISYLSTICILAVIMSGCAGVNGRRSETTKIPIMIYRPAAIDIRARNIDKIAVAAFKGEDGHGAKAANTFTRILTDTLIYEVKGPMEVDRDLLVNGLALKTLLEKSMIQKIGKALEVDAFFLGEVKKREIKEEVYNKVVTEKEGTGDYEFIKDKSGKLEYKEKIKKKDVELECKARVGKIEIQFELYDSKSGNLIFDRTECLTEEVDAFCYKINLDPEELSEEKEEILLDELVQELCSGFVKQLTPTSRTELMIFEKIPSADTFSNYLFRIGIDYAKMGEWPRAIDSFKQCRDKNREKSEAHYNLGVAYKGYGWFEKALGEFIEANNKMHKNLYNEAIQKTKKLINDSKKRTKD
jgi:tetratricopeptide (TPR) repeat protein